MRVAKETVARRSLWWSVRRLNSKVLYGRLCFQVPRVLSPGNRPVASHHPAAEDTESSRWMSPSRASYPNHLGRTVLWAGASAIYGVREHPGEDLATITVKAWL